MWVSTRTRIGAAVALIVAATASVVSATPVASTPQEAALLGRVFQEPIKSTNYIQYAPAIGPRELDTGFGLLQKMYPRYITYTNVASQLHDPRAVSSGGNPLDVITVTDKSVPDTNKQYVLLTFAHSAETCGREGVLRSAEDLAIAATRAPNTLYDDGSLGGVKHQFTVRQLLQKLKIYIVVTSPDGWKAGDLGRGASYSQSTGAGLNSNRIVWATGWLFATKLLRQHGYTSATQPESISVARYLLHVRATELHGRPFAAAADLHGGIPAGDILLHDVGDDPGRRQRLSDLGDRVKQRMDGVFESYVTGVGATAYATAASAANSVRSLLFQFASPLDGLTVNLAGVSFPLQWASIGGPWDLIGYTSTSSWGQWAGDNNVGLGADAITYEINCEPGPWNPALMQLFVDNVRAIVQTTLVHAAIRPTLVAHPLTVSNLRGHVGYYDSGARVTSGNGPGVGVPTGYPGVPLLPQIKQQPYNVSQTDFFRQLTGEKLVSQPLIRVTPATIGTELAKLDTLVIADQTVPSSTYRLLAAWVRRGGNLVLTDRALQLVRNLGLSGLGSASATQKWGYVGYADINHRDPLAAGLPPTSRELYDPVGLGYPLLMNRDGYWSCVLPGVIPTGIGIAPGTCPSGTQNSAPIWTLPTAVIKAVRGSRVIGTVAPPATRQTLYEGSATTLTDIGLAPVGRGRIAYFGALLPTPTEAYPHYFGLFGDTVTYLGQSLLLRAMTWLRP